MPNIDRKLGGIVTIEQETYEDRGVRVKLADSIRVFRASELKKTPSRLNHNLHYQAFQKVVELQSRPLADHVRVLGIELPVIAGLALKPRWFIKEPAVSPAAA